MVGLAVERLPVRNLNHLTQIHNGNAIGDVLYDGQVVGDKQICGTELVLQFLEQVQNLGLNGHIQSGNRLVADNQLGLQRKCAGNADTLALAARELVRIAVDVLGVQTDDVQQLADTLDTLFLGAHAMNGHGLRDNLADGHTRIQRSIGVLEDELHLATHILDLVLAHLGNVFALEEHFACRRLGQAHDGAARGGLTATRLADQAKGLARINLERNVIHSRDDTLGEALGEHAGLSGKLLREVLDLQQRSTLVGICHYASPPFLESLRVRDVSGAFLRNSGSPE